MEIPETVAKINPLSLGCLPQEFCHCKEKLTNDKHFLKATRLKFKSEFYLSLPRGLGQDSLV